jgi:NADH:ubiquinone oxidoreductase subunit C
VRLSYLVRHLTQRNTEKFMKKLRGENDIEATLQRLDRLTLDEARATAAQTFEVVYSLVRYTKVVIDGEKIPPNPFFASC